MWSSEERRIAAIAYLRCTQDCVRGKDQTSLDFWGKVSQAIALMVPQSAEESRTPGAIKSFLAGKVFPDVQRFNLSLLKVQSAKPSGVDDQQVINMAVAMHLNEAAGRDYNTRDFDAKKWINYRAWLVLKGTRKFAPPLPKERPTSEVDPLVQIEQVELVENEEELNLSTAPTTIADASAMFTPIGQRAAKREHFANKKVAADEVKRLEEIRQIRLAIVNRNKMFEERHLSQERSKMIEEKKLVLKLTKGVDPVLYEKTRKELITLFTTPVNSMSKISNGSIGGSSGDNSGNDDTFVHNNGGSIGGDSSGDSGNDNTFIHNDSEEVRTKALRMGANIVSYAFLGFDKK